MSFLKQIVSGFFLLFIGDSLIAQNKQVDSLNLLFKNAKHDTTRAAILVALSEELYIAYPDTMIPLCERALLIVGKNIVAAKTREKYSYLQTKAIALNNIGYTHGQHGETAKKNSCYLQSLKIREQIGDKEGIAESLNNIGKSYEIQGIVQAALEYYLKSLNIRTEIGDKKGIAISLNNIGSLYESQGKVKEALDFLNRALKIQEQIGDKQNIAASLNNLAGIYDTQGQEKEALEYYFKSLKLREEFNDKRGVALTLNNIGYLYKNRGNTEEAVRYYLKSLSIREEIGDKRGVANSLNNLGTIYSKKELAKEALNYYTKSLNIRRELGDKQAIAHTMLNVASVYVKLLSKQQTPAKKQKNFLLALAFTDSSLLVARELGYPENIRNAELFHSHIDSSLGNAKGAFEHYKQYIFYRDSINNRETRKAGIKNQLKYEFEKKSAADSVRVDEEKKVISAQLNEEKTKSYALFGGLGLVLVFAAVMVNRFRVTNKQKKIIELKENETQKQNEIISHQKHLVEEKHKEITDSINYAERIQRSFLATKELLNENLKEYFVFFQPKDVVSGDFYWASFVPAKAKTSAANGHPDLFLLATADSTGHGVPGAIMSILNISSLEKAVEQGLTDPFQILNHTRKTIIERLRKDGSEHGGKDGMDCSLICFDFKSNTFTYSAANNPVWVARGTELIELSGDKMPVGKHDRDNISFTQNSFNLQKGDVVYTLTDGMPDQFGGPKGKKFMYKQLKELLISISNLPMSEQKEKLSSVINSWRGDLEQVDDITIAGIKI